MAAALRVDYKCRLPRSESGLNTRLYQTQGGRDGFWRLPSGIESSMLIKAYIIPRLDLTMVPTAEGIEEIKEPF